MKIIDLLELDENAEVINKKELKEIKELPAFIISQKQKEKFSSAGQWLVLDELLEIDNKYVVYLHDEEKESTWIKLPANYVEEDYMVDYQAEDKCPLGIDVLIKEDGYPIGVIKGCDSIQQAKVDNNLDGHRYKGELGITLNDKYFLTYKKDNEEFKVVKTNVDWDRGKHTI
ncbi:hypothetical protein C7957_1573 [Halanaerobium saccharolyticum]|uniref:Uncharacterized protein n=1 Tax=Halanaerobium saccharolyticum TaxID=43595 RepID=A0A4R6R4H5_9FIRM|nr:hypothetical protein [Halanaerobium saccharolyticum]TDP80781.1 hypothetical protein C7957_1573 [Halanaerobium saccharolyticum]